MTSIRVVQQRLAAMEAAWDRLRSPLGDHFTLLTVFRKWSEAGYSRAWCDDNFVKLRALRTAQRICDQLMQDVQQMSSSSHQPQTGEGRKSFALNSKIRNKHSTLSSRRRQQAVVVAIASALFMNAARRCSPHDAAQQVFRSCDVLPSQIAEGVRLMHLHPDSALASAAAAGSTSEYVVYQVPTADTCSNLSVTVYVITGSCAHYEAVHEKRAAGEGRDSIGAAARLEVRFAPTAQRQTASPSCWGCSRFGGRIR